MPRAHYVARCDRCFSLARLRPVWAKGQFGAWLKWMCATCEPKARAAQDHRLTHGRVLWDAAQDERRAQIEAAREAFDRVDRRVVWRSLA